MGFPPAAAAFAFFNSSILRATLAAISSSVSAGGAATSDATKSGAGTTGAAATGASTTGAATSSSAGAA
eukprot:CAMPEP_0171303844 /NCGR_PEP_ID=MMETSP0816-20121228/13455_1 /TAXON_ID=420281 /ORGANISM="Proboscia inermis, Strain CCAP1064/1" /LENGTH=68 /DNA_ID=CAMNT_0011783439 /DNA_START=598 /DNA_END=804 /DNA_ORIENTATION=+